MHACSPVNGLISHTHILEATQTQFTLVSHGAVTDTLETPAFVGVKFKKHPENHRTCWPAAASSGQITVFNKSRSFSGIYSLHLTSLFFRIFKNVFDFFDSQ